VTKCAYNTYQAKYVSLFSRQGQKGTVAAARYRKAKNNAQIDMLEVTCSTPLLPAQELETNMLSYSVHCSTSLQKKGRCTPQTVVLLACIGSNLFL